MDPRVPPLACSADVRLDVVVVGEGTVGCMLAARLSENPDRSVCLLEAIFLLSSSERGQSSGLHAAGFD
jgi:2-polyprenyl-6-methoxyphenol hydroxylase-like FAD-dependent oxidoreductase